MSYAHLPVIRKTVTAMVNQVGELRRTVAIDNMPEELQQVRQLLRVLDARLDEVEKRAATWVEQPATPVVVLADFELVKRVWVTHMHNANRAYDSIRITLAGMHYACDFVADRDVRLAKHLAESHGAEFIVDPRVADRVAIAIANGKNA